MKHFRIVPSYKRDVYFQYDTERNDIDRFTLEKGKPSSIEDEHIFYYKVDEKDSYLMEYDYLPCIGLPLISRRFNDMLHLMVPDLIKSYPTEIFFESSKEVSNDFYMLVITASIACLNEEKSVIKPLLPSKPNGPKKIESFHIHDELASGYHIFRVHDHEKIVMVDEILIDQWKSKDFQGLQFTKQGSFLRPEFVF